MCCLTLSSSGVPGRRMSSRSTGTRGWYLAARLRSPLCELGGSPAAVDGCPSSCCGSSRNGLSSVTSWLHAGAHHYGLGRGQSVGLHQQPWLTQRLDGPDVWLEALAATARPGLE
jgi:hypothetical protein